MKMQFLNGGRLRMKRRIYIPSADRGETVDLPVFGVLLRHPLGNVLFDTGCHPSVFADSDRRWGELANVMTPIGNSHENIIDSLQVLGLRPEDINIVVNSHFHSDHCGCNEFFKRAVFICQKAELECAQRAIGPLSGYIASDWDHPMHRRVITERHDLFGDGAIILIPLPGHTEGSMGALVTLARDGRFLLAADSVPMRFSIDQGSIPRNTWDVTLAAESMDEIRSLVRQGVTVIYGHDLDQWRNLGEGGRVYE